MPRLQTTLTELARLGFAELGATSDLLGDLDADHVIPLFQYAANPDRALRMLLELREHAPKPIAAILSDADHARRLVRILGASEGLGEFFLRRPDQLDVVREPMPRLPSASETYAALRDSVDGFTGEPAWTALRIAYRRRLAALAAWDLEHTDGIAALDQVARVLADLAGAALDASLLVARRDAGFPEGEVADTRLSIIGMGKAGASELNYVSDVDVIFVSAADGELAPDRALQIATRLAILTSRGIQDLCTEPALWEVDANLRPEGKDGALVRTLESHVAYYERWAKSWEFQALLKARPIAGDMELGDAYVEALAPMVWSSASREHFVESVQRMRERVRENIPSDELDVQLKLGPGGLRDIEFTIQLLQLVHGQTDPAVRHRGTLPALDALADGGYIGRAESAEFARDYRFLRLLEHRIQLTRLRRTHLMPRDDNELRVLARGSGVASSGVDLTEQWQRVKLAVRSLHSRLFYRPLLSAVAALPDSGISLTSIQAAARLGAIGFRDPQGALHHIAALTGGVSRRAAIQRTLLPVMLQWFADGADPDHGLLAFRRLSDDLGESYWFLRMLRDSSGAAQRLTHVLSSSRFVGALFERIPEAAAWLENEDELRPRSYAAIMEENRSTIARHSEDVEAAALAVRTVRRREVLRLALAAIVGDIRIHELGPALTDITSATINALLILARPEHDGIEFGVIAMGRYGGAELGFGSDADVMYVYRAMEVSKEQGQSNAEKIVSRLVHFAEDLRLPLDLDAGLRPEGKNGAIVRSIDSYRAYYERWSLTWEAQALLRARGTAGDEPLLREFEKLADEVRYPVNIAERNVREVKRIKARVEAERLPQGADPARHLKLGRGSLSDVEWFVQLLQLQHGARHESLRTTSTLRALEAATKLGLVDAADAEKLHAAWIIASRARSAMTLWTAKTADVLPSERHNLEGVARLLEYAPGSASDLEEDYLRTTRVARLVFERRFYGVATSPLPSTG